jgi:hypothetical protein
MRLGSASLRHRKHVGSGGFGRLKIGIAPDGRVSLLRTTSSDRYRKMMTKSQIRELKDILVVLANRLRADQLDDPVRVLVYRAQSLADAAMRSTGQYPVPKAG